MLVCHIKITAKGKAARRSPLPLFSGWEGKNPVCRYLLVKAVFTSELELRNSELYKIPFKISGETFTTFRASHMSFMRNDTLSKEESTFLISKR